LFSHPESLKGRHGHGTLGLAEPRERADGEDGARDARGRGGRAEVADDAVEPRRREHVVLELLLRVLVEEGRPR